jgi:hypothetical protein
MSGIFAFFAELIGLAREWLRESRSKRDIEHGRQQEREKQRAESDNLADIVRTVDSSNVSDDEITSK